MAYIFMWIHNWNTASEIFNQIVEQLEKCRPLSSVQNWLSKQQWVQSNFEIIFQYLLPFNFNKKYTEGPRLTRILGIQNLR